MRTTEGRGGTLHDDTSRVVEEGLVGCPETNIKDAFVDALQKNLHRSGTSDLERSTMTERTHFGSLEDVERYRVSTISAKDQRKVGLQSGQPCDGSPSEGQAHHVRCQFDPCSTNQEGLSVYLAARVRRNDGCG